MSSYTKMVTPFYKRIEDWKQYPRPMLRRDSYISLCEEWDLYDINSYIGKILLPFPPESDFSGIRRTLGEGHFWVYKKSVTFEDSFNKGRILLHIDAVDQLARVFINDNPAGESKNGYTHHTFDITAFILPGENQIKIEVWDDLDKDYPYGKQSKKRGGMWYTPISGIWQPVWLESVADNYIKEIKMTPSVDRVLFNITGGEEEKKLTVHYPEGDETYIFRGDEYCLVVSDPHNWTPDDPFLYDCTIVSGEDKVETYFALREISIQKFNDHSYICLNGKPLFFHGLLDQGYYSDGIYLPGSPRGYLRDILKMKELGFNTLRKHIKVEPDVFYYYCDKFGMIVFQDMVNNGKYNFIADTALPTVGFKKGNLSGLIKKVLAPVSKLQKESFIETSLAIISQLYNFPSVCYYTIFNEGWGQFDTDKVFDLFKEKDPGRIWDAASGWFIPSRSDVTSEHVYFKELNLKADKDKPLVLSEFGGYSCKIPGHSFESNRNYGYKTLYDVESFTDALYMLYKKEVIEMIGRGLCAGILTQVSDVEDETNGLVTYDRQTVKVTKEKMLKISLLLNEAFDKFVGS